MMTFLKGRFLGGVTRYPTPRECAWIPPPIGARRKEDMFLAPLCAICKNHIIYTVYKKKPKIKPTPQTWEPTRSPYACACSYSPPSRSYFLWCLFKGRKVSPGVTREIIPALFGNIRYDRFLVMRRGNSRVKLSDLLCLTFFSQLCDDAPKISFQSDGSVVVQVDTPDQSKLLKKTL